MCWGWGGGIRTRVSGLFAPTLLMYWPISRGMNASWQASTHSTGIAWRSTTNPSVRTVAASRPTAEGSGVASGSALQAAMVWATPSSAGSSQAEVAVPSKNQPADSPNLVGRPFCRGSPSALRSANCVMSGGAKGFVLQGARWRSAARRRECARRIGGWVRLRGLAPTGATTPDPRPEPCPHRPHPTKS